MKFRTDRELTFPARQMITRDDYSAHALDDLVWAVASPSLIDAAESFELDRSTIDEEHLVDFLYERANHRVGFYFERLIEYWLRFVRQVDLVAYRQQIREGTQTRGELDFVFRDLVTDELSHLEVAVKFYLFFGERNRTGSHLIGPRTSDTFERKIRRLHEHQLPMGRRAYPELDTSQALVRGRIFYHLDDQPEPHPPCGALERLSPHHLRGTWIHSNETDLLSDSARYQILHKPFWLAPVTCPSSENTIRFEDLKIQISHAFADSANPLLISMMHSQNKRWVEADRMFIVPESWPHLKE